MALVAPRFGSGPGGVGGGWGVGMDGHMVDFQGQNMVDFHEGQGGAFNSDGPDRCYARCSFSLGCWKAELDRWTDGVLESVGPRTLFSL